MFLKSIIALCLTWNVFAIENGQSIPSRPKISRFCTDIPPQDNWLEIPKGMKKITIYVEAENTETVLFWLIPTGTQPWDELVMISMMTMIIIFL